MSGADCAGDSVGAQRHGADLRIVGNQHDDRIHAGTIGRSPRGAHPLQTESFKRLGIRVADSQIKSGIAHAARHTGPHVANADKANSPDRHPFTSGTGMC